VVLVIASAVMRRQGQVSAAIVLVAIVALPALLSLGLFALIVLLFILNG
jgi:hypothetical protein